MGIFSARTAFLIYKAAFTFSVSGTVIGGVMAMAAWYIGSSSATGNPHGMGVITTMVAVPMWWRIFLPPSFAMASIMSGATVTLVVGFSWDRYNI